MLIKGNFFKANYKIRKSADHLSLKSAFEQFVFDNLI